MLSDESTKANLLVKIIFRVTIITIFIYFVIDSIISLHQSYNLFRIAFETSSNDSDTFEPPCISICIKVKQVVNLTSLIDLYSDQLLASAEEYTEYTGWSLDRLIEDNEAMADLIFNQLTLSQIDKIIIPIHSFIQSCHFLDENLSQSPCETKYFRNYYYDKSVCTSIQVWPRLGIAFNRSDLRIPGFRGLLLYHINLDLSQAPSVSQLVVGAHRLNKIPWSQGESTIELEVHESALVTYCLTFSETTVKLLPPPYESRCKIASKPYTSVGHCLTRCFMSNFTRITGRVPHQFVINRPNELKFLHGFGGLERYQALVAELYSPCKDVCGLTDCTLDTFDWHNLGCVGFSNRPKKHVDLQIYPPSKLPVIKRACPQINWLNYFSSIGGVVSLHFGLSAMSIFELLNDRHLGSPNNLIRRLFDLPEGKEYNNQVKPLNVEIFSFDNSTSKGHLTRVNLTIDKDIVDKYDTNTISL